MNKSFLNNILSFFWIFLLIVTSYEKLNDKLNFCLLWTFTNCYKRQSIKLNEISTSIKKIHKNRSRTLDLWFDLLNQSFMKQNFMSQKHSRPGVELETYAPISWTKASWTKVSWTKNNQGQESNVKYMVRFNELKFHEPKNIQGQESNLRPMFRFIEPKLHEPKFHELKILKTRKNFSRTWDLCFDFMNQSFMNQKYSRPRVELEIYGSI